MTLTQTRFHQWFRFRLRRRQPAAGAALRHEHAAAAERLWHSKLAHPATGTDRAQYLRGLALAWSTLAYTHPIVVRGDGLWDGYHQAGQIAHLIGLAEENNPYGYPGTDNVVERVPEVLALLERLGVERDGLVRAATIASLAHALHCAGQINADAYEYLEELSELYFAAAGRTAAAGARR